MAAVDSGVRLANAAKSGDLSNVNAADALNVAKVKLLSIMRGCLELTAKETVQRLHKHLTLPSVTILAYTCICISFSIVALASHN